jgi:hypothetical protein
VVNLGEVALVFLTQLLVRSAADIQYPRNIDIRFGGVRYMELPTTLMHGLELADPLLEDHSRATEIVGPIPVAQVFVLVSGGRRYLVVALGMWVEENDLPFMTSSLERA